MEVLDASGLKSDCSVVKKKLDKLKMNKAPGVDAVGTRMLMQLSEVISDTVAVLFNK